MSFFDKIKSFIKNIFYKKEDIKMIEEPRIDVKKKEEFIKSLKVNLDKKRKSKRIKTLICEGDGLGIQKKMKY